MYSDGGTFRRGRREFESFKRERRESTHLGKVDNFGDHHVALEAHAVHRAVGPARDGRVVEEQHALERHLERVRELVAVLVRALDLALGLERAGDGVDLAAELVDLDAERVHLVFEDVGIDAGLRAQLRERVGVVRLERAALRLDELDGARRAGGTRARETCAEIRVP